MGIKYEAAASFLKQISADITPNNIRQKTPCYLAYRGLVNSEALYSLFGGDREVILGLYEELRDYYGSDFLFWLHYAMAYIAAGDLPIGENYLNQALSICESVGGNPFQILHQKGILFLMQACRAEPATTGLERASEGSDILYGLILKRGDEDSYPYGGYLDYVTRWYVHVGDLIPDREWESLRQIARQAARKFPLDEGMLERRNNVERAYLMRCVKTTDQGDVGKP